MSNCLFFFILQSSIKTNNENEEVDEESDAASTNSSRPSASNSFSVNPTESAPCFNMKPNEVMLQILIYLFIVIDLWHF